HSGTLLPVYRNIVLKDVHSTGNGWLTFLGLDAGHKLGVTLDNVTVDGLRAADISALNTEVRVLNGGNVLPVGDGVSVMRTVGHAAATVGCSSRFPAFPATNSPAAAVTIQPEDSILY